MRIPDRRGRAVSEIPDDIREKAEARADRWVSRGHHDNAALAADFAEALMAERSQNNKLREIIEILDDRFRAFGALYTADDAYDAACRSMVEEALNDTEISNTQS